MRKSAITALFLALVAVGWIMSGQFRPDRADGDRPPETPEQAAPPAAAPAMRVRVADLDAVMRIEFVNVTGRTEASRRVRLRAETHGQVSELKARRGAVVGAGDPVVRLRLDERNAKLAEARAVLRQREIEHSAARQLRQKGFRSETEEAASLARLDAARAVVEQIKIDIAHTVLRAPFDGLIDAGHIELGDYVRVGDVAATVLDLDPILVAGNVSEREVSTILEGMEGRIRLIDGTMRDGIVRFVAPVADPKTRTYRIELEIPNPDSDIRDGITAAISIPVDETPAHFVTPSALTLNDAGVVGVKLVADDDTVAFRPVEIIAGEPDGVWLGGLPDAIRLITVGQEFVVDGERVVPVAGPPRITAAGGS